MSGGFNNSIIGGSTKLIRPAMQSPNYVPGMAGWTVNKDGTVEFNSGVFRGTVTAGIFEGTDFEINENGIFLYQGTPANGNLIGYWTSKPGTDEYNNPFGAGLSLGGALSAQIQLIPAALSPTGVTVLQFPQNMGDEQTPSTIQVGTLNSGAANQVPYIEIDSPVNSHDPNLQGYALQLAGASDDNTIPPQLIVTDAAGVPLITLYNSGTNIQGIIGGGLDATGNPSQSFPIPFLLNGAFLSYGQAAGSNVRNVYNASTTWTCPAGVTSITVQCIGGGAGGQWASGPGGGGGGYGGRINVGVSPGNTYTVTVGSGGAGGTSSSGTGKAGGNSTFIADTLTTTGNGAPVNNTSPSVGGSGTGAYVFNGGGCTATGGASMGGGGGGGGAGTGGNGSNGAHNSGTSPGAGGVGGITSAGGTAGGSGSGGGWGATGSGATTAGGNGAVPGGGGGSGGSNAATGSNGGAGAHGQVILSYTLPGGTAIQSSFSSMATTDAKGNTVPAGYQGPSVAVHPGSSPSTPEGWQPVAPPSGWTGTLRYKMLSESKRVALDYTLTHAALAGSTNVALLTLATGYRPPNPVTLPCTPSNNTANLTPAPATYVAPTGVVTAYYVPTGTTVIDCHETFPID